MNINQHDLTRNSLVTMFVCAVCGELLQLTYDLPRKNTPMADDGITGGEKVESMIAIYPCKKCYQPIMDVRNALKVLEEFKRPAGSR